MSDGMLVDRVRQGRRSGAVLKVFISNIRSRDRTIPILVFEGREDFGPYRVWISRIRDDLEYERIKGDGKEQVLDLRDRLRADASNLGAGVYYFIDRDFDDLKGKQGGPDLFCTTEYSIENSLVSESVLRSILEEELRCADLDEKAGIQRQFRELTDGFLACMRDANRRIFVGRRLGLVGRGIDDSIARYVTLTVSTVEVAHTPKGLRVLVPFEREPTLDELNPLEDDFSALDPLTRHRGKFLLNYFLKWLDLLAAERKRVGQTLFAQTVDAKFSVQKLNLDSLAGRSRIPAGLREFVDSIAPVPDNRVKEHAL